MFQFKFIGKIAANSRLCIWSFLGIVKSYRFITPVTHSNYLCKTEWGYFSKIILKSFVLFSSEEFKRIKSISTYPSNDLLATGDILKLVTLLCGENGKSNLPRLFCSFSLRFIFKYMYICIYILLHAPLIFSIFEQFHRYLSL